MEISTQNPGLLTPDEAARRCYIERTRGGTVVFTNGVFDILHRGHLDYLQEAREMGSLLVVGLNSDVSTQRIKGPTRPINSEKDRAAALLALRFVDMVVLFDEDTPENLIHSINPGILVKGGDYRAENVVGYDHVVKNGGKVEIIPLREGYSTSKFIQAIVDRYRITNV